MLQAGAFARRCCIAGAGAFTYADQHRIAAGPGTAIVRLGLSMVWHRGNALGVVLRAAFEQTGVPSKQCWQAATIEVLVCLGTNNFAPRAHDARS